VPFGQDTITRTHDVPSAVQRSQQCERHLQNPHSSPRSHPVPIFCNRLSDDQGGNRISQMAIFSGRRSPGGACGGGAGHIHRERAEHGAGASTRSTRPTGVPSKRCQKRRPGRRQIFLALSFPLQVPAPRGEPRVTVTLPPLAHRRPAVVDSIVRRHGSLQGAYLASLPLRCSA
jgi:hypothetical protein